MRIVYMDTSVLGRVLLNEPGRPAIQRALGGFDEVTSSRLLEIELGRLARRRDAERVGNGEDAIYLGLAEELLAGIALIPIEPEPDETRDILAGAAAIEPFSVATLDAIHLATAVWLAAEVKLDAVLTYDRRLAAGAREHGFSVLSPA